MSGSDAKRPATYEDLLALPDHVIGEIVDGELVAGARPSNRNVAARSALGAAIGSAFGLRGGGALGG